MPTWCGLRDNQSNEWDLWGKAQKRRMNVAAHCGCEKCVANLRRWTEKDYTLEERVAQLETVVKLVWFLVGLNAIAMAVYMSVLAVRG